MAIRRELDALADERQGLESLLAGDDRQGRAVGEEIRAIRARFGGDTPLGRRRTEIAAAPGAEVVPLAAMAEREAITVLCSEKGWIRAARGHLADDAGLRLKEGDRPWRRLHAWTDDKLLVFATDGRFHTLDCGRLPGGRGFGEPVRLMIDLGNDCDLVALFVHRPGRRLLVAAGDGRGFVVPENDAVAQKRGGRLVLRVSGAVEARVCTAAEGDRVAVVGENRKLLVFGLDELPEMGRGRGVMLQRYRDGGLADAVVFDSGAGLAWRQGTRTRTLTDFAAWVGRRGNAGRIVPRGFPQSYRFAPAEGF